MSHTPRRAVLEAAVRAECPFCPDRCVANRGVHAHDCERAWEWRVRLGAPRTDAKVIARIAKEKAKGLSVRAIATKLGVGVGTVHRVLSGEHVSQAAGV